MTSFFIFVVFLSTRDSALDDTHTCWWFVVYSDKLDSKRRRTERIRRDRIDSPLSSDMENRRRSRANSQSDPIRRGRGRPKTVGLKKQEEEKGKTSDDLLFHILALLAVWVIYKVLAGGGMVEAWWYDGWPHLNYLCDIRSRVFKIWHCIHTVWWAALIQECFLLWQRRKTIHRINTLN